MIDFSSKRAKLALRFFTYGVMTLATLVLSTFMLFFALGYRFDNQFNFTQGGLVQLRSLPDGATVMADGQLQGFKTPNKLNMTAGEHTIIFELAGYKAWSKTFTLEPGQLTWLNYARLIPQEVRTDGIRDFATLSGLAGSPDRRWLLLQPQAVQAEFVLADISNEREPKLTDLTLPGEVLTKKAGATGTLKIIEWDLGSRYILLEHQLDSTKEFIRLDRSHPTEAINVTRQFGLPMSEAHFMGSNPNVLLANTDGVLRRLDLGNGNASGVLVDNLKQFVVHGDGSVAFVQTAQNDSGAAEQRLGIYKGDTTTLVRTLPAGGPVTFAYGEYDNHTYLALAQTNQVEVIRDPSGAGAREPSTVFAQFSLSAPVQWLSLSGNGRMVSAQAGNNLAAYDLEEAKTYSKTLDVGAEITTPLRWLDDFYLWTDAGGAFTIVEFDGTNQSKLADVQPGLSGVLSGNGKRLFSIGKQQSGLRLQASNLSVEN